MPSLIRFVVLALMVAGLMLGGLYGAATVFEPQQREVVKPVNGVTIRR
jgi:hypothetical protein